tara:strand:+ start:7690 stop:8151 length:462 start_codon:yes stop_codon:yes gene_type:complete
MQTIQTTLFFFIITVFLSCISNQKNKESDTSDYSNVETVQETPELEKSISRGQSVYNDFCIQCHLPNGKGTKGIFPPLDGADWLVEKRTESIHAVKYGQKGEIVVNGVTYNNVMPPMGLSDQEVADVMNYVMNSWSNTQDKMVTVEEVKAIEK